MRDNVQKQNCTYRTDSWPGRSVDTTNRRRRQLRRKREARLAESAKHSGSDGIYTTFQAATRKIHASNLFCDAARHIGKGNSKQSVERIPVHELEGCSMTSAAVTSHA